MPKQRLVFISNIPAPYQVKFCDALQAYYQAEFWFYNDIAQRASWWKTDLGKHCRILPNVKGKKSGRYYTRMHLAWLNRFQPDIVLLGGFSIPANWLAYRWAQKNGKKSVVLTETSRTPNGVLRPQNAVWKLLRRLYQDVDAVWAMNEDAAKQFAENLGFGRKVQLAQYPADMEAFGAHPLRTSKDHYGLLFANRLTPIYNPLAAIRIFHQVWTLYPNTTLMLNAAGELKDACTTLINSLPCAAAVSFLENIATWDEMHQVYRRADILLLPALFSNGNFTILEAMASGMGLVISDRILGNGRWITHQANGFRCAPDEGLMAEQVCRYIRNPQLFAEHGLRNKKMVLSQSFEETARLYHQLLSSI
jgi:glycosyltransferase involved in cell wall biosynthesis